jgi:hypothetical protein
VERHWEDQNLENLQNPLSIPKGEKPGLLRFILHHLIGRAKFLFLWYVTKKNGCMRTHDFTPHNITLAFRFASFLNLICKVFTSVGQILPFCDIC